MSRSIDWNARDAPGSSSTGATAAVSMARRTEPNASSAWCPARWSMASSMVVLAMAVITSSLDGK